MTTATKENRIEPAGYTRLPSARRDATYLCKACLSPVSALDLKLHFGNAYHAEHLPEPRVIFNPVN